MATNQQTESLLVSKARKKKLGDIAHLQNHRSMENYLEATPSKEIATSKNLCGKQTVATAAAMTKHQIAKKSNFSAMPAKGPHLHKKKLAPCTHSQFKEGSLI